MSGHISKNLKNFETIVYYDGPIVYSGYYNGKKYYFAALDESDVEDEEQWLDTVYWEQGTKNYRIFRESFANGESTIAYDKPFNPDQDELEYIRRVEYGYWGNGE